MVLTSGGSNHNPTKLIGSEKMHRLIKACENEFDYIIIDTPPVLLVSDALALASFVDGVSLICRHQTSYVNDIARALDAIKFAKANIE